MNRTSGYVFHFGLGVVCKASKKLATFTISSVEAEYVATTQEMCKEIWMRKMLKDLRIEQETTTNG